MRFGNQIRVKGNPRTMPAGVRTFRVDHLTKSCSNLVKEVIIKLHDMRGWFLSEYSSHYVWVYQGCPESLVSRDRFERCNQFGIEPDSGTLPRFVQRRLPPSGGMEDIDYLGQQRDTREKRDRFTGQTIRPPLPVVMLVETENSGGHAFREAQLPRDVGTAMAARRNQFVGNFRPIADDVHNAAKAFGQRRP